MSGGQILGLVGIVAATIVITTFVVLKSVEDILWHEKWLDKRDPMLFEYKGTEGEEESDGEEQK